MLMLLEICPGCGQQVEAENLPAGLCPECLLRRGAELVETAEQLLLNTPSDAATRFEPPDPVELEADLPGYDVFQLLGRGGMGAVYKARHRGLDRIVALKILPRTPGEQHFSERFEREARALARLNHENIVMAFDFGVTERYAYCVMEFVDGPNLRELMQLEGVSPTRAVEIVRDVCRGLEYAHQAGVVHRDIKPENVLVGFDGQVKIADFGLAKLVTPRDTDLTLTYTRHFMGTVHYMAPEQVERPRLVDHRVDIYSTGVLLYEMLTGELPLGRFENPSTLAGVDSRYDDVVLKSLEKDPARRHQAASELAADCETLLRETPTSDSAAVTSETGGRRGMRRRVLIAGGLFGFIGLVLLGWQFVLDYNRDKDGTTSLSIKASGGDEPEKPKPAQEGASDDHLNRSLWELQGHEQLQRKLCGECHTPQSLGVRPADDPNKTAQQTAEAMAKKIDDLIVEKLQAAPLKQSDDAEFIRRLWLDMTGVVPTTEEIDDFVNDKDPQKREKLVYSKWLRAHQEKQQKPRRAAPGKLPPTPNEAYRDWVSAFVNSNAPRPGSNQDVSRIPGNVPADAQAGWVKPSSSWKHPSGPSEDLPIYLSDVTQVGEYPEKRLELHYEIRGSKFGKDAMLYIVLSAAHAGIKELPLSGTSFDTTGVFHTPPLPKISDGDPVDVFIEVERPGEKRLRASNVVKIQIHIAGTPKTDIRYSEKLLSPFKAIHWEADTPQVQIGERWYELLAINNISASTIMEQAKKSFPDDPQRAFEQDLLELIGQLDRILPDTFSLTTRELPDGEETVAAGFKLSGRERAITQKIQAKLHPPQKIE